jgi:hypothetical protein
MKAIGRVTEIAPGMRWPIAAMLHLTIREYGLPSKY